MKQNFSAMLPWVLLCAFGLRLYQINTMSLRADEASNLFFAAQDSSAIVKQLVTDDPHAPLYYFLLHYWIALAGNSELALRFPGVLAGTLIVALLHLFGKILLPDQPRVALAAAALAAINPSFIWDAQDAHLYPLLVLTSLASMVALVHLFVQAKRRAHAPPRARTSAGVLIWLAYALTSASALYLHYIAAFILAGQGVMAMVGFGWGALSKRAFFSWLLAQFAIGAFFLPWFLLAGNLVRGYQTNFFPPANILEILTRSFQAFTVGRVDDRLLTPMIEPGAGLPAAAFISGIFLIGLWSLRVNRAVLGILVALVFAPLFGFAIFGTLRFSIFDERYVLYLAPAFLLIAAHGLIALYELPKGGWVVTVVALALLAASAYSLHNYWHVPVFAKSPDWKGLVEKMVSESQPGDVLIQNYPDPALPYYLKDRVPRVLLPRSSVQSANDLSADLTRLTTKYDRVWLQPAPGAAWDIGGLVSDWFAQHAREIHAYDFRGVRLELYQSVR